MSERENSAPLPWRVPVALDDVPEDGQHFDLVADDETRVAVAQLAGLRDLPRLQASFDISRHGSSGLRVAGRVSAIAGQTCVVTLEPLANEVSEEIDLLFEPPPEASPKESEADAPEPTVGSNAEPLLDGKVDLGALATEFLILGLDPYPRKPGAVFEPPADASADPGPFAALGALKKGGDGA
jgi:Large ribosomal RNA subunit accumulation protein YceD